MQQPAIEILNDHLQMAILTVGPDGWPQKTIVGSAKGGRAIYLLIFRDSQKFAKAVYASAPEVADPAQR